MSNDIKQEMRTRAQLAKGLTNVLQSDLEYVCADARDYDIICLNESIRDTKDTLQKLVDNIKELEYLLYLTKQDDSRKLHSPL